MNASINKTMILFVSMLLILVACNLPSSATATPAPVVTAPSIAVPSSTPGITHTIIPVNLPEQHSNHAGDYDSSTTAKQKQAAGGDRFSYGNFERPFNANTMDTYFPYLDIVDLTVFQDDTWTYAAMIIRGPDAGGKFPGKYAMEIDLDLDGRGDFLVMVSKPASTDWSTDGVQVWQDANHDVGGEAVIIADLHPKPGDGYETLVFDSGKGNDPDLAWARISPTDSNTIQLAIKRSILGNDPRYMIGAWDGTDSLNPANFDFNDHMTHTEAGAASRGYEIYYPIKGLAEIDNTCRVPVGFQPTGSEPGLCPVLIPPGVPGAPTAPACPPAQCPYGRMPYPNCQCIPG